MLTASGTGFVAPIPPVIAGVVSGQTTTSEAPVKPFAGVTIGDANPGATDTLTITLGGAGGALTDDYYGNLNERRARLSTSTMLQGTTAMITRELDALFFTPIAGAAGHILDDDVHAQRSKHRWRRAEWSIR